MSQENKMIDRKYQIEGEEENLLENLTQNALSLNLTSNLCQNKQNDKIDQFVNKLYTFQDIQSQDQYVPEEKENIQNFETFFKSKEKVVEFQKQKAVQFQKMVQFYKEEEIQAAEEDEQNADSKEQHAESKVQAVEEENQLTKEEEQHTDEEEQHSESKDEAAESKGEAAEKDENAESKDEASECKDEVVEIMPGKFQNFKFMEEQHVEEDQVEHMNDQVVEIKPDIFDNSNFIFTNQNSVNLVQDSILKTNRAKSDHSVNRQNSIKFEISPPRNLITQHEKEKILNRQPTPYTKTAVQFKTLGEEIIKVERNTIQQNLIQNKQFVPRSTINVNIVSHLFKQPNIKKPFLTSEIPIKNKLDEKVFKSNNILYKASSIARCCVQCDEKIENGVKSNTLPCSHKVHQSCLDKINKKKFECPKCNNKNRFI